MKPWVSTRRGDTYPISPARSGPEREGMFFDCEYVGDDGTRYATRVEAEDEDGALRRFRRELDAQP